MSRFFGPRLRGSQMSMTKLKLITHRPDQSQVVFNVLGSHVLGGLSDTGVFRIESVTGPGVASPGKSVGTVSCRTGFAEIEHEGPLLVIDPEKGADPYNRTGRLIA